MQKWEYMNLVATTRYLGYSSLIVESVNDRSIENYGEKKWSVTSALQQFGDEGWELVNVVLLSSPGRDYGKVAYFFKRQKA